MNNFNPIHLITRWIKLLLATMLIVSTGLISQAGIEPELMNTVVNAPVNYTLTTYDIQTHDFVGQPATGSKAGQAFYHLVNAKNKVGIEILQDRNSCPPYQFTFSMDVLVETIEWDESSQVFVPNSYIKTLSVDYDSTIGITNTSEHAFVFENAYWVKVTVQSVSSTALNNYINLYNTIQIERYEDIDPNSPTAFNNWLYDANTYITTLSWQAVQGAEAYELEYQYIDDYSISGPPKSSGTIPVEFKNNATRILVKDNFYKLSMVFDKGYVLFRVRAIGLTGTGFTDVVLGAWSYSGTGLVSDFDLAKDAILVRSTSGQDPHEAKLNWQYSATFAENGLKKEIISYFDGSLRQRQTVTRLNTEQNVAVAESYYDYQGRPAVTALPAPAFENKLKFYEGFNLSQTTGNSYDKSDFDVSSNCARSISAMATTSGASKYYSPNNPKASDLGYEYIPNGFGYTFAVTEYTPDNSGRIRRQGGVGPDHQLDSDHETKYFYGTPAQEELDRLFGNNIGHAEHYQKNMVVDPNGQVSVSYLDLSGRVIATALSGDVPSNLDALPSAGSPVGMEVDIVSTDNQNLNHITARQVINVAMDGEQQTLSYSLDIPTFVAQELPTLCFDCVYELEISLTDECSQEQLDGDPNLVGNQPIYRVLGRIGEDFDIECNGTLSYSFVSDLDLGSQNLTVTLNQGTYTIHKTLRISERALEYYKEQYFANNTALKTQQDFEDEYLAAVDYSDCELDCQVCDDLYSTEQDRQDFINAKMAKLTAIGLSPDSEDEAAISELFDQLKADCEFLCTGELTMCEQFLGQLKADMRPGGQYATYEYDAGGNFVGHGMFDEANYADLGFTHQTFNDNGTQSSIDFTDNGQIDPYFELDGSLYQPLWLTAEDYVNYFKEEWVDVLVKYHPEYCHYEFCQAQSQSEEFDAALMATTTYKEAYEKGYLNPLGLTGTGVPNVPVVTSGKDPFFDGGLGDGTSYEATFTSTLTSYLNPDPIDQNCRALNVWEASMASFACDDETNCSDLLTCLSGTSWDTNGICKPLLDRVWIMLRSVYLSEKRRQLEAYEFSENQCLASSNIPLGYEKRYASVEDEDNRIDDVMQLANNQATQGIQSQCSTTCAAQADAWLFKLEGCDLSQGEKDQLSEGFRAICEEGCDESRPFGSTDLTQGQTISLWSQTFASFEEVFDYVIPTNDSRRQAGVCDINLVNFPLSYDHDYDAWQKPDTQGCNPETALLEGCIQNASEELKNSLITEYGPDSSCNTCKDCYEVYDAIDQINGEYSASIETLTNFETLLENRLNKILKFNLSYWEYIDFIKQCANLDSNLMDSVAIDRFMAYYDGYATIDNYGFPTTPNSIPLQNGLERDWLDGYIENLQWASIQENQTAQSTLEPLDACHCNKILDYKDQWDNMPQPKDPFGTWLNNLLACEMPGFDFEDVAELCKKAYLSDASAPTLPPLPTYSWTAAQISAIQYHYTGTGTAMVPDCFNCTDPPTFSVVEFDVDPITVPLSKISCNDFIAFLNNYESTVEPNIRTQLQFYCDLATIKHCQPCIESIFEDFMDAFYTAHPDPNYPDHNFPLEQFLDLYQDCFCYEGVPGGCSSDCREIDTAALYFLDILNQMENTAGSWGVSPGRLITSNWSVSPDIPAYYNSDFYDGSCSSGLKYVVKDLSKYFISSVFNDYCSDYTYMELYYASAPEYLGQYYYDFDLITSFDGIEPLQNGNDCYLDNKFKLTATQDDGNGNTFTVELVLFLYTSAPAQKRISRPCLKLCNKPYFQNFTADVDPCKSFKDDLARYEAKKAYAAYKDSVLADFEERYMAECRLGLSTELFERNYQLNEYHYTLYYYDQSGNLSQTVPPAGVNPYSNSSDFAQIASARSSGSGMLYNAHSLPTQYTYNSLNQLTDQVTPDGGHSEFWYDDLGRIVISQNAKQRNNPITNPGSEPQYSYTQYDGQGRIVEVGQLATLEAMSWQKAFDDSQLASFISNAASTKEQVTITLYDNDLYNMSYNGFSANNLRSRVVAMIYDDDNNGSYDRATHYSYDIHGNVDQLLHEYKSLASIGQDKKLIEYDYELISGNVNKVYYQKGEEDQFIHGYSYDADNRLVMAETSTDDIMWQKEVSYEYFLHGPLMRQEVGDDRVQGIDYAYTIHGWLKSVNSNTLDSTRDIGRDALAGTVNEHVASDVFGYSLGYYGGDYHDIGQTSTVSHSLLKTTGSAFDAASSNLYNGNIKHMVTAIKPFMGLGDVPQGMTYSYDQLNRIKSARAWDAADALSNEWLTSGLAKTEFACDYTYDANGNILSLKRNGDLLIGTSMDDMTYHYIAGTNQLEYVTDAVTASPYTSDIESQSVGNYAYDEIGNLVKDDAEGITNIEWTVYGKIKSITKNNSANIKNNIEFEYAPDGNRSIKRVHHKDATGTILYTEETYYFRDASGNTMATYVHRNDSFFWEESTIYGSSRVGTYKEEKVLVVNSTAVVYSTPADEASVTKGLRQYEMSNHLGNVLAVVSDKLVLRCTNGNDYYDAAVIVASDYYPFGMQMEARVAAYVNKSYKYGFNGKRVDNEVSQTGSAYDYGYRIYSTALGRFFSKDPLSTSYPWYSPYQFAGNKVTIAVDMDGLEEHITINSPWFTAQVFISMISNKSDSEVEVRVVELINCALDAKIPEGTPESVYNGTSDAGTIDPEQNHEGIMVKLHIGQGKYITMPLDGYQIQNGKVVKETQTEPNDDNSEGTRRATRRSFNRFRKFLNLGFVLYGEGGTDLSNQQKALPGMKLIAHYVEDIMNLISAAKSGTKQTFNENMKQQDNRRLTDQRNTSNNNSIQVKASDKIPEAINQTAEKAIVNGPDTTIKIPTEAKVTYHTGNTFGGEVTKTKDTVVYKKDVGKVQRKADKDTWDKAKNEYNNDKNK